jgi:hypothetical protein
MNRPSPEQSQRHEQLDRALREQGADPAEIAEWLPVVERLADWPTREPGPEDARRLLAALAPLLPVSSPVSSPVRQAIRERQRRQGAGLACLLDLARTQVSLFGAAFWLASALVTLAGAGAVLTTEPTSQVALLHAIGPLLAYLGTVFAFRGREARVLEVELVCLPSPAQLALARLVIVLGYDVCLGLALALVLWAGGAAQVLTLTLAWFMPLLLVAGVALLLSLRLAVQTAAALAYGSWLAVLAITTVSNVHVLPPTPLSEAVLGGFGLALLTIAVLRLHTDLHHLLPQL